MKIHQTALVVTAFLGLFSCTTASLWAADGVTIFTEPPTAGELAEIMFPQRTRSIVFGDGSTTKPSTAEAGQSETAQNTTVASAPTAPEQESAGAFGLLITFEFGKDAITSDSIAYLDAVGEMLKLEQSGNQAIVIEGHTDSVGSESYNQNLSERRALAVRRYLVGNHNIDALRLNPVGRGESRLHDAGNPAAAINRRVEFKLLASGDAS